MILTLPIRTKSGDNAHTYWRGKARQAKAHRSAAALATRAKWRVFGYDAEGCASLLDAGLVVTLTRVAPSALDTDGNASGMKSIRDGIADALGLKSDRDPRITWAYAQRRAGVREYAVEVAITPRGFCPTCGAAQALAAEVGG